MKSGICGPQKVWNSLLVAVVLCLAPAQSWAAIEGYATIVANGEIIEGEVEGSRAGIDVTDKIAVLKYNYGVHKVIDPSTGLFSGQQHRPVRLLKRVNRSSPRLFEAMTNNKEVEVVIDFFRTNPSDGSDELFYTVTLTRGRILSISPYQSSLLTEDEYILPQLEWISVVFHTIEFESTTGGGVASDSWNGSP